MNRVGAWADADRDRFRVALEQILEVTDPGDLRSRDAREAWEQVTPARRIAREALGLPIGGRSADQPLCLARGTWTGGGFLTGESVCQFPAGHEPVHPPGSMPDYRMDHGDPRSGRYWSGPPDVD